MWMFALAAAATVQPDRVTVPAAGQHEVVVSVSAFGRYRLTAESDQGMSLQVVDAMTGPGPIHADGRAAQFLDRGRVKVVVRGDPRASGEAVVSVRPLAEAEATPRLLPSTREVTTTLGETQQRSYWIDVPEDGLAVLDAAGRYLDDLRLWREGSWLVDAAPACDTVTPVAGQPWQRCVLTAELAAGLYLATAYGGGGEPWAQASTAAPLVIREGAAYLGEAGRLASTLGPSGYVRYRLGQGGTVHLALPEVAPASLVFGPQAALTYQVAEITEKSRRPTATIRTGPDGWVTVLGTPGQRFQLTWFGSTSARIDPGDWYITTVHAADARDVLDPAAVLFSVLPDKTWDRTASQGIPVDRQHRVERSFNLAGLTTTLLDVKQPGTYRIGLENAAARFRPLVPGPPLPWADVMDANSLEQGLYELLIESVGDAVVTLRVAPDGGAASLPLAELRPCVSFPNVHVDREQRLTVSAPTGAGWGLVQRKLPLDPVEPVPVTLLAGETIELPITVAEPGVLRATTPEGKLLPLSVDGRPWGPAPRLTPGEHRFAVRSDVAASASVALVLDRLASERPLPPLPMARSAALPRFPVAAPGRAVGVELEPGLPATVALSLPEPGLYRIESTGLLATAGTLRTRTTTSLASADRNGVGRNFLIGRYLGSGEYQVTLEALDGSAGHAGVRVIRARIDDGGDLPPGTEARATVLPDAAIRYDIEISEAGWYRLRHEVASRPLPCRVQDADGWPIVAPDQDCDWTIELAPGRYELLGAPTDVEMRRHTVVQAIRPPTERQGHGPFALAIGLPESHTWREPVGESPRDPDVWEMVLSAPIHGALALSPEMEAELIVNGQFVGRSSPGLPFAGEVPAGALRIEVRGARRGTGVPYTLALSSAELVAGAERPVDGPTLIPVSVGAAGVYTFASRGSADVRARLVDAAGRLVAANDDRPDDWNFRLTTRLEPGRYTLQVDPVTAPTRVTATPYAPDTGHADTGTYGEYYPDTGVDEGEMQPVAIEPTIVAMRAPGEVVGPPIGGAPVLVALADGAVALPIQRPTGSADVVVVRAASAENVGVAIEVQVGNRWEAISTASGRAPVAVARVAWGPLRARLWSEDLRGIPATVEVEFVQARPVAAAELLRGVVQGRVTAVRANERGAQYRIGSTPGARLFLCGLANRGCEPTARTLVSGGPTGLVLVAVGGPARVERIALGDAPFDLELASCGASGGACGVDLATTGPVAVIARASAGQPVVSVARGIGAVIDGAAIGWSLDGARRAELWEGSGAERLDVAVEAVPLERPTEQVVGRGRSTVALPPRGSAILTLDAPARARVALEAGLVAAVDALGAVWAAPSPTTLHVGRAFQSIVLINPTDAPALAVVDLTDPADVGLNAGAPFEQVGADVATWLIPVTAGPGTLHARGALSARYRAADGRVLPAEGALVGTGGTLVAQTRPGPALAWVDAGAGGPTADLDAGDPVEAGPHAVVPIGGMARRLRVQAPAGQIASVTVPVPVVARVVVAGRPDRVEILGAGDRLDLLSGGLPAYVTVRALRGAALYGEVVVSSAPVVPTGEGVGPEQLVAGGGVVFYSFVVEREGPVGVGVRSPAGQVDALLYDEQGSLIGHGALVMAELKPGSYLLGLSRSAGTTPARVQPAVVGLSPPPVSPPADVVRGYARAR